MKMSISVKIVLSLSLSLCLVVGSAPWHAGVAAAAVARAGKREANSERDERAKGDKPGLSNSNASNTFIPRFLRIAAPQIESTAAGQSATLMPDGNWLLLGGQDADGSPVGGASLKNARTGASRSLSGGLQQPRAWHTATLLPDGTVLVLGGVARGGKVVDRAEIFHPGTQQFETLPATAAGLTPRARHTATLLTEGFVLVAGGTSAAGEAITQVELWDTKTRSGVVVIADKLQVARKGHTATIQPDGSVLLWGGINLEGASLDDGELYEPATRRLTWLGAFAKFEDENDPYLRASLPQDGATDVPVDARIALRFSKSLNVTTVNGQTVKLNGPEGALEAKITPAEGGMLAFIIPQEKLSAGTTYNLTVSEASDANNRVMSYTMLNFTTAGENPADDPSRDGEDWLPDARNMRGDWRSHRPESRWQKMPPLEAAPGVTALAGQVLLLNGNPLANVTLQIGARTALTDNTGRFLLTDIPAGHHVMRMDGRTASRPKKVYGVFKIGVDVEAGKTNALSYTSWMPRVDTEHVTTLPSPTTNEVAVTSPFIPGLEVRVPQSAVVRDMDGQIVTQLSITPIPVDRTPFPLPPGVNVPVFFTVQPGAARVIPPRARVIYPNYGSDRPGTRMNFWNYDPEGKGWYIYGQGTVSADGRNVVPDAGVVIYEFNGFMINRNGEGPPPPQGPTGNGPQGGDGEPVDLGSGLFINDSTDLVVQDVMPLVVNRKYRPQDSVSHHFGIGTSHPYNLYLYSAQEYVEADLILPDGARIHYVRISAGTGFSDAEFEHTTTPGEFYKSRLKWNGNGWDLTLKSGLTYVFGDEAPLHTIKDRHGNKIIISRANSNGFGSPSGPVTKVTSPNGRWMEFTYDTGNRVTQVKDNIGRTVNYTYDSGGRLWKVTNPLGGVTEYSYDTSNRMTAIKDAKASTYLTNTYDASGRVTKQTQGDGTTYLFAYTTDASGKITQTDVTDQRGIVRRVTFGASGFILTDTSALGKPEQQTITYEREAGSSLVLSKTDASGRKTAFTYDPDGNLTSLTRLAGTASARTINYTYESNYRHLASITDPGNHKMSFAYDAAGNLTSVSNAQNRQSTYTYNAAGQVTSLTNSLGKTTQLTYSGGDLERLTNSQGRSSTRFTDDAGRVLSVTDTLARTSKFEYDALDRVVKTINPLLGVTSFGYDANGNILTITDARNNVTSFTYDNMDRVLTRTDSLGAIDRYAYDAAGNITEWTDRRGKKTTFKYDSLNRRTFAGFGTVTSAKSTTYESTITYSYGTAGGTGCTCTDQLTKVVDSVGGTITLGYDQLGRMTSQTTAQGTTSYEYNTDGLRTKMTVAGQTPVVYNYNDAHQLTSIVKGAETTAFAYDEAGRRTRLTLPNGVTVDYAFNDSSELKSLTYKKDGAVIGDLTYGYDDARRRTSVGGSFSRLSLPSAVSSITYNNANRMTGNNGSTLSYDSSGNLLGDGATTYTWDARGQMASMSRAGLTASFQYDGFGRRTQKTVNGSSVNFLYDGDNIVQELSGTTPIANITSGGIDETFSRSDSNGSRYFLTDGVGSTVGLTDANGAIQTQYSYEPYGATASSGASSDNSSQFTGRENDGTGLYYYRARYYSPKLQRFISEDPSEFSGGDINLYAYAGHDPVSAVDPMGLASYNWGCMAACGGDVAINLGIEQIPVLGNIYGVTGTEISPLQYFTGNEGSMYTSDALDYLDGAGNAADIVGNSYYDAAGGEAAYQRARELVNRRSFNKHSPRYQAKNLNKLSNLGKLRNIAKAIPVVSNVISAIGAGADIYSCFQKCKCK